MLGTLTENVSEKIWAPRIRVYKPGTNFWFRFL